jgi:Ca-activated chloride channel family protein
MAILIGNLIIGAGRSAGIETQSPSFHSGVDVVALSLTVMDTSGRYIAGLVREDFQVFEDGRRQQVTFFQPRQLPLALALLMDTSASMQPHLGVAQDAAAGFVRALGRADRASVIDFDSGVRIGQEFTTDHDALERAIRSTTALGSTALYNAVYIALKELEKTTRDEILIEPHRRAMVILSDGQDTSSLMTFDEVLDVATRSDTAIYAIGLFGPQTTLTLKFQEPQYVLRKFAGQTGGRAFFIADARQLNGVYAEIRAELANQYFLAYASNNTRRDGQFRHVAVRVDRPNAVVRARPGYYAPAR